MQTKLQNATTRLKKAQTNFVKVHKAAMKKAAGSVPAGRLKKRRRRAGGKKVMGFDVGPGWKKQKIGAIRAAKTAADNERNFWTNVRSKGRQTYKQIRGRY